MTMKLSNLSVGLRLGASFGAILLITALIAATGMWRIASLQNASERVATQEIEQQTLVEDWASDIRLNWVRTEAFLKAIDRDYMDKLTADTQATATGMEAKVKRIEALVHSHQTLLANDIPSVALPGGAGSLRVIAGDYLGRQGPARTFTPPLVAGERVFVQSVDRSVRAYDAVNGRWLWQYQRPGGEPLALATSGALGAFRDTLLVGQGSRLVGLDPLKGTVRFDVNVGTPRGTNEVERLADLVGPMARADDEVCVRAFQLSVACLELNRGSLRWSRPQAGAQAVAANERLVVGADGADRLTAWKTENGDVLWRADRFTHRGLSAPAIIGERVAVVDAEGYLHLLSSTDGRTLARIELDSAAAAAPLVANQLLYVTTRKGTLYALRAN